MGLMLGFSSLGGKAGGASGTREGGVSTTSVVILILCCQCDFEWICVHGKLIILCFWLILYQWLTGLCITRRSVCKIYGEVKVLDICGVE